MKKLTELYIKEHEQKLYSEIPMHWQAAVRILIGQGRTGGQLQCFTLVQEAKEHLSSFFNELLTTEEQALSCEPPSDTQNYFVELTDQICKLVEKIYVTLRAIALKNYPSVDAKHIVTPFTTEMTQRIELVITQMDTMKERLRLGLSRSSASTVIHVKGDAGVINTGTVYGSIHSKLEKTIQRKDADLSIALNAILTEIKNSRIDDKDMRKQMQNVEFLIDQYKSEHKNPGLLDAALTYLAGAANLATIWSVHGPAILAYFEQIIK